MRAGRAEGMGELVPLCAAVRASSNWIRVDVGYGRERIVGRRGECFAQGKPLECKPVAGTIAQASIRAATVNLGVDERDQSYGNAVRTP
jgi:hypothetical protein